MKPDDPRFYEMADDNCPDCGAVPAIMWRDGGVFQQRTECICGRVTRWVLCGHDAHAAASDATANNSRPYPHGKGGWGKGEGRAK